MPHARRERQMRPRPKAGAPDLHHLIPQSALGLNGGDVEQTRAVNRRLRPHPPRLVAIAVILLLAVIATSSTFWFIVFQEDGAARLFFPVRDLGGIQGILAVWGCVTQVMMPLTIVRRLQTTRRLLVARSLKLVLFWTVTSAVTVLAAASSPMFSPWFAAAALPLLPAAYVLLRLVRAAVAVDE